MAFCDDFTVAFRSRMFRPYMVVGTPGVTSSDNGVRPEFGKRGQWRSPRPRHYARYPVEEQPTLEILLQQKIPPRPQLRRAPLLQAEALSALSSRHDKLAANFPAIIQFTSFNAAAEPPHEPTIKIKSILINFTQTIFQAHLWSPASSHLKPMRDTNNCQRVI